MHTHPYKGQAPRLAERARAMGLLPILITDRARLPDPVAALPTFRSPGLVIVRDYDDPDRADIANTLVKASRGSGHLVAVAGDPRLANRVGADGVHLPGWQLRRPPYGMPLLSCAAHNRQDLFRASTLGVGIALVSPVFSTRSHPGTRTLGVHRLARMTDGVSGIQVAALGGVNTRTVRKLKGVAALTGIAGIDGYR